MILTEPHNNLPDLKRRQFTLRTQCTVDFFTRACLYCCLQTNRPRSIYQYSNMAPRLSRQTSKFGVVFFAPKSLLGIERQKKLKKFAILTRKPRSHVRILIYRTWPIAIDKSVFFRNLNGIVKTNHEKFPDFAYPCSAIYSAKYYGKVNVGEVSVWARLT